MSEKWQNTDIQWATLCQWQMLLGHMSPDFTKTECLALHKKLKQLEREGKVIHVARGHWRSVGVNRKWLEEHEAHEAASEVEVVA